MNDELGEMESCNSFNTRIQTRGGYRSLPSIKQLKSVALDNDTISEDSENNDWKEDPPNIKNFIFNKTGFNLAVPENVLPMFFLNLLLTDDLLNTLLQKTNEYGDRIINKVRPLQCRSLWSHWKDVNLDEMRKFIGILFSMFNFSTIIQKVLE